MTELWVRALDGVPEVRPGDDLVDIIIQACAASGVALLRGDVLVIAQKIVSKVEGRLIVLDDVDPSDLADRYAHEHGRDPRQLEMVFREARRIVRMDKGVLIAETRHGFVCANAGVDASNVPPGCVCLLPEDPDASARLIRDELLARLGVDVGVIISDSFGRPWRDGIINVAIGVAGLAPLVDLRGSTDASGRPLTSTVIAVADELASAAELVMNKAAGRPVVVIRGYEYAPSDAGARSIVMPPERDMFR